MTAAPEWNVLLIGSGGREHALAWRLAQSSRVGHVFVAPGNGGTANAGKISNVSVSAQDFTALMDFARKNNVGLVVPGSEQPLVDGIANHCRVAGIPCFGPCKDAARLEGSKAFSKEFMKRHRIPTADYQVFSEFSAAKAYVESVTYEIVIKASGLAAGKGVLLPVSKQEAMDGLKSIMVDKIFGAEAGAEVVIEERLRGEECSILAFTDGYTIVPFPAAQDHKRIFDGDQGPNTGGMGAYAPAPVVTPQLMAEIQRTILKPTIDGIRREGTPFVGILYAGIMLTSTGPMTLEYNCRFGDPETQVIVPLLADYCDLAQIMLACANGCLDSVKVGFKDGFAATVVAASQGYPDSYPKGHEITCPTDSMESVHIFHAGTAKQNGKLVTSGGRVLAVTCLAPSLENALANAYTALANVHFAGMQFRKDIGHRALKQLALLKNTSGAGLSYADAGVSIDHGNLLVEKIKAVTAATKRPGSNAEIGGFGGLFDLQAAGYAAKDTILVSATDGVGTKLRLAHIMQKHDTIGIDLVAMNVNDLVVQGAEPLFFLDYYACGKLDVDVARDVVSGIAQGCLDAQCALVGGETAEMPGFYEGKDYDLGGFTVGAVERRNLLPLADQIRAGDILLGLASSGVHSNGYSLVRHVVSTCGLDYHGPCPFDTTTTLGEALLTPTRIYVRQVLPLLKRRLVKAMAHITGGGFVENIPRVLPQSLGARMDARTWPLPPVFRWLKKSGISNFEMSRTFNCGIGMILVAEEKNVAEITQLLKDSGETVYRVGALVPRSEIQDAHHLSVSVEHMDQAWSV